MGRLFSVFLLSALMLLPAAGAQRPYVQPVFFSMLFPQLIPESLWGEQMEGVVFL